MQRKILFLIIFSFLFLIANPISAHPGNTDSSGCHTCRTNCPDWGLSYGEYHCSGGYSQKNSKNDSDYTWPLIGSGIVGYVIYKSVKSKK